MSILSLLLGLFGCGGNKKYTIDDIVLVHTGYYGMESNPVYSFAMRKEEDNWVFSASCRVGSNKDHYTSFSSFPITDEDAQGFLQIIREDGEIEGLFKYRNPIRIFHISDAPARSFGMTFSDGNSVEKETRLGDRALDYLYALADRHYKSAESVEVTAVSIHRNCMDYSSSCSFCLEKTRVFGSSHLMLKSTVAEVTQKRKTSGLKRMLRRRYSAVFYYLQKNTYEGGFLL